jgi:hypothetical protein
MVGCLAGGRGSDAADFTTDWSEMRGDVRGILARMLALKKTAIGTWLVFAWVLPAAIAGALGWSGIWGSTSAFTDYLLPLPVAGGFLHSLPLGGIVGLLALSRGFPDALRRLVPAVLAVDSRVDADFLVAPSIPVAARGDDAILIYSRRLPSDPLDSFASDQALYFTNSLEAAEPRRTDAVFATCCMYEDGTPPMWLDALGDCFSSHDSFDDLRQAAIDRLLATSMPRAEAADTARAEACRLARRPPPRARYMEVAALRSCPDR